MFIAVLKFSTYSLPLIYGCHQAVGYGKWAEGAFWLAVSISMELSFGARR